MKNRNSNDWFLSGWDLRSQIGGLCDPRIDGAEIELIDTHIHTRYSDGAATVRDVEEACREREIGCCITDHNEIRGTILLAGRGRVPCLPAIEVGSREQIDLLLFFRRPESCEGFFREHVEPYRSRRWYAWLPRSLSDLMRGAESMTS